MKGGLETKKEHQHEVQEPQKCIYIYNRRTGVFEQDSSQSDTAIEFKLADYAIKHVLSDFEDNSQIWFKTKLGATIFLMVFSLVLCCVGTHFLDKEQMILGAFGAGFGLILQFQSLKLLLRKRESGDDKAASYYWKLRDVYNIKLFYHNLRVEMFYQDGDNIEKASKSSQYSDKNYKENMDLVFEFSTIDNKKSNIENWRLCQICRQDILMKRNLSKSRMKNSFLTADTGLEGDNTLRSEKISPEGEDRSQKKGILDGLMSRGTNNNSKKTLDKKSESSNSLRSNHSEYESDANLISHRREMNLSIVDEEFSPGNKKDSSSSSYKNSSRGGQDEYMPTTQRGLITEEGDEKIEEGYLNYQVDCELGTGSRGQNILKETTREEKIREHREKNKLNYSENFKQLGKQLSDKNLNLQKNTDKENIKPLTKLKGPNMNLKRICSPEKRQMIKFQSFKDHNTPKLPSIKKRQKSDNYSSGTKRLESSTLSREERLVSLKDSSIFLPKKTNEFSFYNNKHDSELVKKAKFQFSNKKPRLNFDEIPVSPARENKPQSPVKNEIIASNRHNDVQDEMMRQPNFGSDEIEDFQV